MPHTTCADQVGQGEEALALQVGQCGQMGQGLQAGAGHKGLQDLLLVAVHGDLLAHGEAAQARNACGREGGGGAALFDEVFDDEAVVRGTQAVVGV